jgi:hypothetical protein
MEDIKGGTPVYMMSAAERRDVIAAMAENFDSQDEPKVGFFWYDPKEDELFGVNSELASNIAFNKNGMKTLGKLHKDWWKKEEMRARAKGKNDSIFLADYTQIPRGRVFEKEGKGFQIMCGNWMNERIKEMVVTEFDLQGQNVEIVVDTHWEIGRGWSDEF